MIKKFIGFYIRFVQKILISIFLTLTYFLILSLTKLFMLFLPNKQTKRKLVNNSYWINSEGNDSDLKSIAEQS